MFVRRTVFTGRKLFVTLLALCCLAIPSHFNRVFAVGERQLVACHDNIWDPGEYCGHDAVAVGGAADMNHDCLVDALDLQLFVQNWNYGAGAIGPNLSGDFKSNGFPGPPPCGGIQLCPDGKITLADYSFFVTQVGHTASPCTPVPIPSVCDASIALSFSSNPNTIDNNDPLPTGPHDVYVVVSGVVNAEMVEFTLKTSPNVQIVSGDPPNAPGGDSFSPLCVNFGYNMDAVVIMPTPVATGPAVVATLHYVLTDTKPAWITIVPTSSCPYAQSRWTDANVSLSHKFASMSNVGINGTTPANAPSACTPSGQISGQVYSDKNFNCAYNSGTDDLLANLTVQATPGPHYALTDASGNYTFTLPSGPTYIVKMVPSVNDPWKKLNTSCGQVATYTVPVAANGTYPNKNFAMQPLGKITGLVYRDFVTACVKDAQDRPIASRMLLASGTGNYIGYSDKNGNYAIDVPAGAYNVTNYPISGDPWAVRSCQLPLHSVNVAANATATGKDFALELVDTSKPCDVFLNLTSQGTVVGPPPCNTIIRRWPCPGIEWEYQITVSEHLFSGVALGNVVELDIVLDAKFAISSVTSDCTINIIGSPSAYERVVGFPDGIYPGNQCVIKVRATPSADGPYTATVTLDDQGMGCTGTLVKTLTEYSNCSCDPNDMWVQPSGCGPDGEVAQGTPLTYTINFENVGTGKAHNIFVEDVLDDDVDLSTVSIVSSSHPVTGVQVNGNNKLVISFEGIDLPGTVGPGDTHGHVMFTVRPLPVEEQFDGYVENSAAITFDFNDPVITNTVINTFVDDPCIPTPVRPNAVPDATYLGGNYPNPFNPSTTIEYGLKAREHVTIAIYNINGSLVRMLVSDDKPAGWYTIAWDGRDQRGSLVASGVYFSQMRAGSFSGSKKLVLLK